MEILSRCKETDAIIGKEGSGRPTKITIDR